MHVTIKRDGQGVHIGVRPEGATEYIWFTNNDGPGTVWDQVMVQALQQSLENHTERDRERAYRLGWADAKARRRKKDNFNCCFNSVEDIAWE